MRLVLAALLAGEALDGGLCLCGATGPGEDARLQDLTCWRLADLRGLARTPLGAIEGLPELEQQLRQLQVGAGVARMGLDGLLQAGLCLGVERGAGLCVLCHQRATAQQAREAVAMGRALGLQPEGVADRLLGVGVPVRALRQQDLAQAGPGLWCSGLDLQGLAERRLGVLLAVELHLLDRPEATPERAVAGEDRRARLQGLRCLLHITLLSALEAPAGLCVEDLWSGCVGPGVGEDRLGLVGLVVVVQHPGLEAGGLGVPRGAPTDGPDDLQRDVEARVLLVAEDAANGIQRPVVVGVADIPKSPTPAGRGQGAVGPLVPGEGVDTLGRLRALALQAAKDLERVEVGQGAGMHRAPDEGVDPVLARLTDRQGVQQAGDEQLGATFPVQTQLAELSSADGEAGVRRRSQGARETGGQLLDPPHQVAGERLDVALGQLQELLPVDEPVVLLPRPGDREGAVGEGVTAGS